MSDAGRWARTRSPVMSVDLSPRARRSASSPGVFDAVHLEDAPVEQRLALGEPRVAGDREALALAGGAGQLGAGDAASSRARAHVIGVGEHDPRRAAELLQVGAVVGAHRQRIDDDVAVGARPDEAVEVDVEPLVEHRPAPQVACDAAASCADYTRARLSSAARACPALRGRSTRRTRRSVPP